MKKTLLSLVLAACLMLAAASFAVADTETAAVPAADDYVPARISICDFDRYPIKIEQEEDDIEYEALLYSHSLEKLEVEIEEDDVEYEVLYNSSGSVIYAECETDDSEIVFDGSEWHDGDGNVVEGPDLSFVKQYYDDFELETAVYPHNTMSLVGLPLQEVRPGLTDKWYHIVPVDLTKEGTVRYRTAVSNMYLTGYCDVTVQDGKVTVDYAVPEGYFEIEKQCMAWFTDIEEITPEFLNDPQSGFRYGVPVDIGEELNGQEIAILFICNRVTYQLPLDGVYAVPVRYYPGSEQMKVLRQELTALLERMQ